MEQEINVQDIENQKPMELATGQGISRFQNVLRDDAVLANENLQKVVEKSQGVEGNIEKLLSDISQEGAFRSSVEGMAGVPQSQQRLNELARLSSVETRQLQKDILGNELQAMGTMETRGFLDARDARANRESAIRSLTIASEAELLQGNLEQARALVDKAVSAKFEPMKQELEIRKFNLDRLDKTQLEPAQKAQAEATKRKLDSQMKEVEKQQDFVNVIATNQAPNALIEKALKANSLEEAMTIDGIQSYLQSPLEKAQISKLWADINEMKSIASPGMSIKQRQDLLKDATARQASSRIGVIQAIKDYSNKVELLKGQGTLSPAEKRELESALNTTVGSAINVAQGQGAMGDSEAERILGNLKPSRLRSTNSIVSSARGVMDAQDSLLQSDFGFIDSSYPGATDSYQLYADYKRSKLEDVDLVPEQGVPTGNKVIEL
jgi:hypothetical protein